MRIGELSERTGVPTKTIRYYEDIELMPAPARTPSGYRDYGAPAVERLQFIKASQSVGFSLGEIREVLGFRDRGETPCGHVTALIERHAADVAERIRALRRMQADLERLARRASRLPPHKGGYCHIIGGLISRSAVVSVTERMDDAPHREVPRPAAVAGGD